MSACPPYIRRCRSLTRTRRSSGTCSRSSATSSSTRSGKRERSFCHSCWTPSSGCAGREATLRLSESCSGWRSRQESLAALELIEQMAGYALLKGYFEDVLAMVLYQRNRLEEARGRLRTVIGDAATWQQSDLLLSGYIRLMQVELARRDLSAVQQALQEFEQLEGYQGYHHWSWLPIMRAQWWLAQGQMKEAADWAVSIVFPEGAWERSLYDAFPVVMRVYFAELRWTEALELLDRFSGGLDRPANVRI